MTESSREASLVAPVNDKDPPPELEKQKMQGGDSEEQVNSQQPPSAEAKDGEEREVEPVRAGMTASVEAEDDGMTDEERERRYTRFFGEEAAPLRAILNAPGAEHIWGPRMTGFGLGILDQAMEEASRRKDKDPMQPPPPREPVSQKIQGLVDLSKEEASPAASVKDKDPPPEPEGQRMREEEVNSQPPPWSQSKVWCSWSSYEPWGAIPLDFEKGNPATWISDEFDGEWRPRSTYRPEPYHRDPDPEAPQYFDDMAEFYLEAARRLPVAQMPRLAGALSSGGLLLGFHDPVTNIIVNAISLMEKYCGAFGDLVRGTDPVQHAADRASYVGVARRSRAALVKFMAFYFRHLTEAQAKRYLRAARHDLAVAIGLVEWHRNGGFSLPSPDCSRTMAAFRHAAKEALRMHNPHVADLLAELVEYRFPRHLLDPVLDDLRRGEQLSVARVNDILNLLRHPWSPPPPLPPPTPGTFQDADGNVTIIAKIGQDLFSTTTITTDRVAAFNKDRSNNVVTTTTISRHQSRPNDDELAAAAAYLFTGSDTKSRLRSLLSTTTALQLQQDINSLKMCLLDTIHCLYIQALAMLPSDHQPRLLRAVLASGHCYGVMEDPVSNIVVNSIWYNARFPHTDDDDDTLIKATRGMARAESSSLHGLIAMLRADRGLTEEEAVTCLRNNRRNLSQLMMTMTGSLNHHSLAAAAEAAKHPQQAALVAFLVTLLTPEKRDRLRSLLTAKRALSDADFKELNMMIAGKDIAAAPVQIMATAPDPSPFQFGSPFQPALNTMSPVGGFGTPSSQSPFNFKTVPAAAVGGFGTPSSEPPFSFKTVPAAAGGGFSFRPPGQSAFGFNTMPAVPVPDRPRPQSYVRTKVEELLLNYGRNNPLGPQYKLGLICGVDSTTSSSCCRPSPICFHVNFLASTPADTPNDATTSPPECKLFFVEFWDFGHDDFEHLKKPPVCCPIQDYHAFPGRCFICEWDSVRIVHPPCGNYSIGRDWYSTDTLCAAAERHADLGEQDPLPVESSRGGGYHCC